MSLTPRPYQTQAIQDIRAVFKAGARRVCFVMATGAGKCLARNTPVLMADGRVRMSQDIQVGDRLLGPDSRARTVMGTGSGHADLFRVTPVKGDPFTVTGNHVLSFRVTKGAKGVGGWYGGETVNMTVLDWVGAPKSIKHLLKIWRVPVVFEGATESKDLPLDPYFIGLWLGDGHSKGAALTTMDGECASVIYEMAHRYGLGIRIERQKNNRSVTYNLTAGRTGHVDSNPVHSQLKRLRIINNKHIPYIYKTATREARLQLLAGLLDSDGHYDFKTYNISQKSEALAADILFIARSLGLAAYANRVKKKCYNNGKIGNYTSISISGELDSIPCRLPRKRAQRRKQIKDALVTGVRSIEHIGIGEYFGFEVDGDNLYLLGDMTVTHNTAVASLIGAGLHRNAKRAIYLGHRTEIVFQLGAALRKVAVPFSYLTAATIGMPRASILVASMATLHRRKERIPFEPDLLFVDECQHSRSRTWEEVIHHFPKAKVVGLTATPCRLDGKGLGDVFDTLVEGPDTAELIADGFLSDFQVYAPKPPNLTGVHMRAGDYVAAELDQAMRKQAITGDAVKHYTRLAANKSAVVFCVSVAHAEEVAEQFRRAGYKFQSIDGKMSAEQRQTLIADMTAGRIHGLTSCDIISEGTDIPRIEVVVMLRPTKSFGLYRQMAGRGLRLFDGKDKLLILDHAGNTLVHGMIDEPVEWSLAGGAKRAESGERSVALRNCPKCLSVHKAAPECPRCGHVYVVKSRVIEQVDGDLELMVRGSHSRTGKSKGYWDAAYEALKAVEKAKGYGRGWAEKVLAGRQEAERQRMARALEMGVKAG